MKSIIKIVFAFIFLSILKVNAQNQIVFGLQKEYTKRHIGINRDNPYVYPVVNKIVLSKKSTRVKKESPEYLALEEEIFNFENKQEEITQQYKSDLTKYNRINTAIDNVITFLSSQKPVEASRNILEKAQKTLIEYGIDDLVYADNKTNILHKTKFLILSSNYTNLKVHLRNVVFNLTNINTTPNKPLDDEKIEELRLQLQEMSPYVFKKGPTKTIKKTKKVLGSKTKNIPSELVGEFVIVNNYTIITKDYNADLKKGYLIEHTLAKKQKLIEKGYAKKTPKRMIKNISTKKVYLVDYYFLKKYAYTFNGKFRYQAKHLISVL